MKKIALQLYSIRDLMAQDVFTTLKEVSKAGYFGVEFAGFFDVPAAAMKRALDEFGLAAAGSHTSYELLSRENIGATIAYNQEIGNRLVVCPGLPQDMRGSADDYKRAADFFNQAGERLSKEKMLLYYHNHAFEFQTFGSETGLDILMKNTEPRFFGMELDTYWAQYAGVRPVDIMDKYKERCNLLHLKDMKNSADKSCTELGRGVMDFPSILALGKKYGVHWYIVEQENFDIPELESIAVSAAYLDSNLPQ